MQPTEEEPRRLSFMTYDSTPYSELLMKLRSSREESADNTSDLSTPSYGKSILSRQSDMFASFRGSIRSESLGRHDTLLLDMVRARRREVQDEAQDEPLDLPRDDASDDMSNEACVHGLSLRCTERSVSRSRVSRMSTRRDMDIPSILAFTTSTPAPAQLEIPAFQKASAPKPQEVPKWSIRRSVCPVCSQKWKDRSSVEKIKNSGLKRSYLMELPSVIAPARLRSSIRMGISRPALVAIENDVVGLSPGGFRNNSASWQLTRARRFRSPKPQLPPPEATAPPASTAPLARKDLDTRVYKFLTT